MVRSELSVVVASSDTSAAATAGLDGGSTPSATVTALPAVAPSR